MNHSLYAHNTVNPPVLFTQSNIKQHTVSGVSVSVYTHIWVQSDRTFTQTQKTILSALLNASLNDNPPTIQQWVITARMGTLSPWSSKAADIAAQCGINGLRLQLVNAYTIDEISDDFKSILLESVYDKMIHSLYDCVADSIAVLNMPDIANDYTVPLLTLGQAAIEAINIDLGLALSTAEINNLYTHFSTIKRDPTDVELMMFAQANSEHCRHKIFNSIYTIDGVIQPLSMFDHIRTTHKTTPQGTIVAYSDNAAVIGNAVVERFRPNELGQYIGQYVPVHAVLKAETHNHPTAISPYAGAATGAGGEIRDEGATGRGAQPRAGLTGFTTSLLDTTTPNHLSNPMQIMLDAPLGAAAFNNEFGRPALGGYWRAYKSVINETVWGYHKPIMIAAGWGTIDAQQAIKQAVRAGDYLVQLGGPGLKIGIGGGAASSMAAGNNQVSLDFNSVQRDNPEMQRRAQMVINACIALGENNPIRSIHDVGAGGLSNAFPEIVHAQNLGALINLEHIPLGESGLNALEIWCNESQERYSLAIAPEDWDRFERLCHRERCPVAKIGIATEQPQFQVIKHQPNNKLVDWAMDALLGKKDPLKRQINTHSINNKIKIFNSKIPTIPTLLDTQITLNTVLESILKHPTVASKRFLITIGDRTVGGYTHRDPMVGPWQEPVSDCAVTLLDYASVQAEAASMGERTPLAVFNPIASGRMAIAEALTNLVAAPVFDLNTIKLSCNWMAAANEPDQDLALYQTVKASATFCRAMNLAVPVGKDSLSMQVKSNNEKITSPVSLIVTAYAPLLEISNQPCHKNTVFTPYINPIYIHSINDINNQKINNRQSSLLMVLKANPHTRLAGSIAQQINTNINTIDTPDILANEMRYWWNAFQAIRKADMLLSYHDVSDGGLWVSLCEMAFTSRCGLRIDLTEATHILNTNDKASLLFNEEIAAVIHIQEDHKEEFLKIAKDNQVFAFEIAKPISDLTIHICQNTHAIYTQDLKLLHHYWDSVSAQFTAKRDNPAYALQESQRIDRKDYRTPYLHQYITFELNPYHFDNLNKNLIRYRPKVAILREQGINSMVEMAYAWTQAGFDAYDVTMTDLIAGRFTLLDFQALVACGGFSYGDVLGAGVGWANSILYNPVLRTQFKDFFHRLNTIALGVCNGCQMMSYLDELMPSNTQFPRFTHNDSGRYESRLAMIEIIDSPSIFLKHMVGTRLPVAVAHGEGRLSNRPDDINISMRFVDAMGYPTEIYPMNPNGSKEGETAVCSVDGRVMLMMPHPERMFRYAQWSFLPEKVNITQFSPWMQLFYNAYTWCCDNKP